MKHPILQRHHEEVDALKGSIRSAIASLRALAETMPRTCPMPEGYACACTGVCHPPEYHAVMAAIFDLEKAVEAGNG